jgi:hypothetical protein
VNSSGRFRPKATPCRPGPAVRPANGAKAAVWVEHGHRACTCGAARWRPRHRCAGGLGGVRFSPLAQARHGRGARQVHEGESSPECPIDDGGVKVAVVAAGSCSKGGDRGGEVHGGAAEKGLGGMAHRREGGRQQWCSHSILMMAAALRLAGTRQEPEGVEERCCAHLLLEKGGWERGASMRAAPF